VRNIVPARANDNDFSRRRFFIQTHLFIGGGKDGLNIPVAPDLDAIEPPVGVTGKENYISETLTVGDASITVYRHESLSPEQVLN
jgi:hypothetical protein